MTTTYRDRQTAENKLRYNGFVFNFDLVAASPQNRKQRRAVSSAQRREASEELQTMTREIEVAQLGAEFWNVGTFPISIILEEAESEFEALTPPRTKYPKEPVTVLPGIPIRMCDERIPLNPHIECGRLEGRLKMRIRYGHPGKERHTLDVRVKRVDILMDPNGFYRGNATEWESEG